VPSRSPIQVFSRKMHSERGGESERGVREVGKHSKVQGWGGEKKTGGGAERGDTLRSRNGEQGVVVKCDLWGESLEKGKKN